MKKRKNKAGFTLVEVVVVMTIFGILFGAILNLLQPVNDAYKKAQSVTNTNAVGSGLNKYIEGQVRFGTEVLILQNYQGVPKISDHGTFGTSPISYSDCLILDNSHVRGSQEASYVANETVASKMGCTGTVLKVSKLDQGGFSMDNSKICMGVDYYGNETYNFSASLEKQENVFTVKVLTTAYQYNVDYSSGHGVYKFDKNKRFDSDREFELTNVNLNYSDNFVAECIDMDSDPTTYTTYPKETSTTGSAAGQQAFYNDGNKYTYIFFNKSTRADECRVSFNKKQPTATTDDITVVRIKKGKSFSINDVPQPKILPGYGKPYYHCTENGNDYYPDSATDWNSLAVVQDLHFEVVYPPAPGTTLYTAHFHNIDTTKYCGTDDSTPSGQINKCHFGSQGSLQISGGNPECNYTPDDFDSNSMTFVGWYTQPNGAGAKLDDIEITADNMHFYPYVKNKPKVQFKVGSSVISSLTTHVDYNAIVSNVPTSADIASHITSGQYFAGWYKETTNEPIESYHVTSDVTFVAKLTTVPTGQLQVVSVVESKVADNHIDYTVKIANTGSQRVLNWKLDCTLPSVGIEQVQCPDYRCNFDQNNYNSTSRKVVFTTKYDSNVTNNLGQNLYIDAGATIEVKISCYKYNNGGFSDYATDPDKFKLDPATVTVTKVHEG